MRLASWRVVGVAVATAGLGAAAAAQEVGPPEQYHLRVEFAQWTPKLGANLQIGTAETPGTPLDLKSDLGFADKKVKAWSGTMPLGRGFKLRGSMTPIDYNGDVTASRTFSFNGRTYDVSERVVSSVTGHYYTGGLELDFIRNRSGYLGLLIGAQIFDMDATLAVPALNVSEQRSKTVPIPVVGASGRFYVGRVSFSAEASGLTIGKRGHVYELSGSAGLHLSDRLAVKGGYRRLTMHGEDGPDLLDLNLEGWHYGAELSF